MTISELEDTYQHLHEQLLRGELDEHEFKAEVERLRFEDDGGRQWKIGWYTGQWYRYDQGEWIQGQPQERITPSPAPAPVAPPQAGEGRGERGTRNWLVLVLVGLLSVAGIALVAGLATGRWADQDEIVAVASPTGTSPTDATETLPSPTRVPATATMLPSPTRTVRITPTSSQTPRPSPTRRAATPGPTRTAAPAPTSTPERTPTTAATVAASRAAPPTATPSLSGRIYFPVYDPNVDRKTFDVYVYDLKTGKREIVVGQASQPALSPDGQRLAFRSWDSAKRGLLVRELTDGNTWVWINFAEAARPSWSPDSENIVFPSQQESDRLWRIYRTLGREFDRVRRHGGDILGRVPIWLSDGRIVYWECPENKCGLYVMQTDGTNPVRLTMSEDDTAPAASPDGEQVAFVSNRDGNWEIYVVSTRPAGGEAEQGLRRLTQGAARDGLPAWSPDGKWLAFVSDRDGAWAMWVMRPDGSGQRKLFDLGGPLEGEIANVTPGDQHGWTWEAIAWGP